MPRYFEFSKGSSSKFWEVSVAGKLQDDNFTHNIFIKPRALEKADFRDLVFYEACD